jgi:hypothetical protein
MTMKSIPMKAGKFLFEAINKIPAFLVSEVMLSSWFPSSSKCEFLSWGSELRTDFYCQLV